MSTLQRPDTSKTTTDTQTELQTATHSQTELVTSSCMPFHIRVPVPGQTA